MQRRQFPRNIRRAHALHPPELSPAGADSPAGPAATSGLFYEFWIKLLTKVKLKQDELKAISYAIALLSAFRAY